MTETKQAAGGRTVHLALVQFESVLCDPAANTQKACRMIAEAAAEGADLVVLPELFSTGYELNIVGPHVPELAEPVDGPTVHLWALERFYFRSGCDCPVFDTDFGRIGVMICYDMGFPEVARMLALQGADLILCPSAWCQEDMDVWDVNAPARALENTAFVAAVNRYGVEDQLVMPGHTKVCNPRGHVVAELAEEAPTCATVAPTFTIWCCSHKTKPNDRILHPRTPL